MSDSETTDDVFHMFDEKKSQQPVSTSAYASPECSDNKEGISEQKTEFSELCIQDNADDDVPCENENLNTICCKEEHLKALKDIELHLATIKRLEEQCQTLEQSKEELQSKLEMVCMFHFILNTDLINIHLQAIQQKELATKEKEATVIRYAVSEKHTIEQKQLKEQAEKKYKEAVRENEILQHKITSLNSEKARICQMLDNKVS